MKIALLFAVLFPLACGGAALGTPVPPAHIQTVDGTIIFYPDQFEGYKIFSIKRLNGSGRLEVFVNPLFAYQRFSVSTRVHVDGNRWIEETEFIEIITTLKPAQAAMGIGARDSFRVLGFPELVFDAIPRTSQGERPSIIQVRRKGTTMYLLVITRYTLVVRLREEDSLASSSQ